MFPHSSFDVPLQWRNTGRGVNNFLCAKLECKLRIYDCTTGGPGGAVCSGHGVHSPRYKMEFFMQVFLLIA